MVNTLTQLLDTGLKSYSAQAVALGLLEALRSTSAPEVATLEQRLKAQRVCVNLAALELDLATLYAQHALEAAAHFASLGQPEEEKAMRDFGCRLEAIQAQRKQHLLAEVTKAAHTIQAGTLSVLQLGKLRQHLLTLSAEIKDTYFGKAPDPSMAQVERRVWPLVKQAEQQLRAQGVLRLEMA